MRSTLSVVAAAILAFSFAACAPSPNGPRLDTNRAEVQVREAFAESLDLVRRGSPEQVMSTLSDDFVFKTETGTLARDAGARRLPADRQIIKFDKVTPDSVVVTSDDSNRRYVEIWVRTASGWKLARMNELATYAIHS